MRADIGQDLPAALAFRALRPFEDHADRVDLGQLYQQTPAGSAANPPAQFASQQTRSETYPAPPKAAQPAAAAAETRLAQLNAASPQTGSPQPDGQSIIVILQEGGENRMVTVKQPSPELRSLLEREMRR